MINSPLRYPGGKAKLFPFFVQLIKDNNLLGLEYCEPYAGGAGLAIKLLTNGFVDRISINDLDVAIFALWKSIVTLPGEFCKLIEKTPISVNEWHRQKLIWVRKDFSDPLSLGFATFFLNRTNRSGIIDGAGPIGGYEQRGTWKINARYIKDVQIENILLLARYSRQISVSNLDAAEFIKLKFEKKDNFVYLDPPYYEKGRKLYTNFYEREDHLKIAKYLGKKRKLNWIVSYDDSVDIREMYETFPPIFYYPNYSANLKTIGNEIIFLSDGLSCPLNLQIRTAA